MSEEDRLTIFRQENVESSFFSEQKLNTRKGKKFPLLFQVCRQGQCKNRDEKGAENTNHLPRVI